MVRAMAFAGVLMVGALGATQTLNSAPQDPKPGFPQRRQASENVVADIAVHGEDIQQITDTTWNARLRARYRKIETRIRMRDGVHLFTAIYVPRDTAARYPVLFARTPYSVGPYGTDSFPNMLGPSGNPRYADDGYIFVYQDVRGRYRSEGTFREMSPIADEHPDSASVDEGTDTYDSIEWLLANVRTNGKVGLWGWSYPGFYVTASCLSRHPALVACSPQAPITDIWMGDDLFHGGAFLFAHNWGFYTTFGRTPRMGTGSDARYPVDQTPRDAYQFFLNMGAPGLGALRYLEKGTAPAWDNLLQHPAYDAYWKARDVRPHLTRIRAAVLTVGGFYDVEDLAGPWNVYKSIARLSPNTDSRLVVGPWAHGGWARGDGDSMGNLRWTSRTAPFYRDSIEFPFFSHHLKGTVAANIPKVMVFRTGADHWDRYAAWPPPGATVRSLFLQANGGLSLPVNAAPKPSLGSATFDAYTSDPARPVPLVDRIESRGMPRDYITGDQRFASRRPDVLTYQTSVLTEDVTITGDVRAVLHVSTSGTDADFIVKLIDVFPDNHPDWPGDSSGFIVAGYQQLVRGEPFRMRYRRAFDRAIPMVPHQPDSVRFELPAIHHQFKRGHRIMVQIHSSWFPYIDRNPQTFVPNIFFAPPDSYRPATMRVYRTPSRASRLDIMIIP